MPAAVFWAAPPIAPAKASATFQTEKSMAPSPPNARRKLRGSSLLSDHAWREIGRTLGITKRELQIVQSVFDNQHEPDIAQRFKISSHTVHMHLNRLFKKLTVTSRTELVLRIVEQMVTLTLSETAVLPPICPRHHTGECCLHRPSAPSAKP
jgi:DNA-binding CsgD family transcriptional regulator